MIQCIALDLDRTTLNEDGKLSKGNKEAIEKAIAKGIHVIIASGRPYDSLPKDVLEIKGIEYAITSNGAAVYEISTGSCLRRNTLSEKAVDQILSFIDEDRITCEAILDGVAYAPKAYVEDPVRYGATPQAVEYVKNTRRLVDCITEFIKDHKRELDCIDMIAKTEEDKLYFWELLKKECEGIYVTSSVKQLLEISDEKCGKHSGVKYVAEKLSIEPCDIAAFGDGDNDIDMLQYVGHGFAVANATDACKMAARYEIVHHSQDAILYGLKVVLGVIE